MEAQYAPLIATIGLLFLAGLAVDAFGRRIGVPRVTLLILLGAAVGPAGFDVLPDALTGNDGPYAGTALTMVAFLLGGGLTQSMLREHGGQLLAISGIVVVAAFLAVGGGLWLAGVPLELALVLGALACATAPATTREVVLESGQDTPFSRRLLGIVAIDDAWGLIAFSIALALGGLILGASEPVHALQHGAWEILGAFAVGGLIGLPAAHLTGRLKPGEPTLLEALGVVFLTAGVAMWAEVSLLLAGMVCGAVIANIARHHEQPFHEIERIEWPFMLLFFVMAGASLEVDMLAAVGALGVGYIALRAASRIAGGWLAGITTGVGGREGAVTGLALMAQAGVAIGMALVATDRMPQHADTILAVTVASTVFFEIVGPFATQVALRVHARRDAAETPQTPQG